MKLEIDTKYKTIIVLEPTSIEELFNYLKEQKINLTEWLIIPKIIYPNYSPLVQTPDPYCPPFIVTCATYS